ncbi:MAG: ferritin-like domain-containing protein [Chitinophagaceae bacterium]|nr:ferritin-like domain-containing protein [Chitinophagaceae bacterium]
MAKSSAKKAVSQISSGKIKSAVTKKDESPFTTDANLSLQDLFIGELRDTYWAEKHLVNAIPKMVDAAGADNLKEALADHLEVTKTHVSRLEKIFQLLGEKTIAKKCDAMEGLTMSGEHVIENTITDTEIRDIGIIMSALKVENFEITTYKGMIQVAHSLGKEDVADLLQQNHDEEIEASNILTEMSQSITENQPAQ